MGTVVTFAEMARRAAGDGVSVASITRDDAKEMAAEYLRVEPGKRWSGNAPNGADCYLFALAGSATLLAGAERQRLAAQTFATIAEGVAFTVVNDGASPLDIVKVIAPPAPREQPLSGFTGTCAVAERDKTPVLEVPEEKKRRIIFVGHNGAHSERAHAMIVVYAGDTHTALHHHPNADSLFVLLDGAVQFTVNGKQDVLKPGQAVYFPAKDVHGLRTAPGHAGASFLEFHIPAAYSTVKLGTPP